ncbi:MAG: SRPBCC domain-containing protein [Dehalococcoidia bacterium]
MTGKTNLTLEGEREMVVTRVFDAPRELVFKAWTEAEALLQWWGPRVFPTRVSTVDLRPGGKWHYCMVGPEGQESWGIAKYREIVPPERLVYTDWFSNKEGEPVGKPMEMTVEFTAQGRGTLLRSRAVFESKEHRDEVISMGMEEGLSETLDRLDEYLVASAKPVGGR